MYHVFSFMALRHALSRASLREALRAFPRRCRELGRFALLTLLGLMLAGPASAAGYFAQGGRLYDDSNREIQLRGINHFGFNTAILQPQYLWSMGWKEQIAQIKSLGFNAVRLPIAPDTLYVTTPVNTLSYMEPSKNADLIGKTSLQVLDLWMAEANRQGLYVLLDMHGISTKGGYQTWFVTNPADFYLIYNKQAYTQDNWIRDLVFVANRYAALPMFLGIDVFNEPYGVVRWAAGDPNMTNSANYWKPAVEQAAAAILAANPRLLIFVEGINGNWDGREDSRLPMNWGEDFQPQAYQPLNIPAYKLVLSPHTYGPDVFMKSTFTAPTYPANLAPQWETLFGKFSGTHPVVLGEWGGKYGNGTGGALDIIWQNALVDYLISKNMRSTFYWCYTPNSGDTGGILDDKLAVREDKMALLRKLWGTAPGATPIPTPTPTPVPVPVPTPTPTPTPTPLPPPPPLPAGTYAQPYIQNFAPSAGPVGTVVTMNGRGFTGLAYAKIGKALNAKVTVLSDAQVQVTVPAEATTGAIGLFNPKYQSWSATSFTVQGVRFDPTVLAITSFSPWAGRVGTKITISGRGMSSVKYASVGAATNIKVSVLSDSRLVLVLPAGATTAAIGLYSATGVVYTPTPFTVR